MAIDFLKAKKRQRYLIMILVFVVGLILIIIWRGFLGTAAPPPVAVSPILFPAEIKINWEALKDARLSELQPFPQIPSFEAEVGRKDPFVSY